MAVSSVGAQALPSVQARKTIPRLKSDLHLHIGFAFQTVLVVYPPVGAAGHTGPGFVNGYAEGEILLGSSFSAPT